MTDPALALETPLSQEELDDLRRWVADDTAWPEDGWRNWSMFGVVTRLLATLGAARKDEPGLRRIGGTLHNHGPDFDCGGDVVVGSCIARAALDRIKEK